MSTPTDEYFKPNDLFDDMVSTLSQEMTDLGPANLPDASVSIAIGWITATASLKNGKLDGLANMTRQCDVCVGWESGFPGSAFLIGTLRLTDLKIDYTAKASGVSKDVSGTVDYVDFEIRADFRNCNPGRFPLTQCDITVGHIDVSIGNGWLNTWADNILNKATTKVSNYLINDFEAELCTAIDDHLNNDSDLVLFFVNP